MLSAMDIINNENPLREKWRGVSNSMAVHTQDRIPTALFKERRPLESEDPNILGWRENNYRNTTKEAFDLAINQYIEAANSVDASIEVPAKLQEWNDDFKIYDGYKEVTLKEWLFSFVGRYRQTDPNSAIVVLPKHPTSELIPSYESAIPSFDEVVNQAIQEVAIWLVPSSDISYIDDYTFAFKAGSWLVNSKGESHPYFFKMSGKQIWLIYPKETDSDGKKVVTYSELKYYKVDYKTYTAFVVGGKTVVESNEDGEIMQYYISDFYGAAQIGDILINQLSDLQIIEARFTYPLKWQRKKECGDMQAMPNEKGVHCYEDGSKCRTCGGLGYIADTTPFGTFLLDNDNDFTDTGAPKIPFGFVTPDTAILKHDAERVEYYQSWMQRALGLNVQNLTNQSGESKRYDMMQKVSLISSIVTDLYRLYENVLNSVGYYIGESESVKVTLPEDLDVKNANDLSEELIAAKKADLPLSVLSELTKKYMLAKFGNNPTNRRKVDYLAMNDKLFIYGINDLKNAIAIYGTDITSRDKVVHAMGWQILSELLKSNPMIPDEALKAKFDSKINAMMPIVPTPQTIF